MMQERRTGRREFMRSVSAVAVGAALAQGKVAAETKPRGKRIATFSCEVTPLLGTPIYSSYLPLATIEYPLLAKGVVIEDEGGRYVLCAVDWCEINNSTHTLFRKKIAEAAQTDIARVAVQTVHQHTAPMADDDAIKLIEAAGSPPPHTPCSLSEDCAARVADAVKRALDTLAPFDQIGTGQACVEHVASNRRVPIGEGKVGFRASSCKDPNFIAMPEGLIDPYLKTITFALGGKPLARLHYYGTHPQSFYGDPRASYDFAGMARERLEKEEGVFQVYFTGCEGNIAAGKYNDGTPAAREGLFERLFAGMKASTAATQFVPAETIHWRTVPLLLTPRDDGEFAEAACRATMANAALTPNARLGAAATLAFRARSQTPFILSALQIGKTHILHLPGESVIEYQLFAQELLPDQFVAVAAVGDCGCGYLCLEKFFPEGGYEPTASNVIPTSEQAIRAAIRQLVSNV